MNMESISGPGPARNGPPPVPPPTGERKAGRPSGRPVERPAPDDRSKRGTAEEEITREDLENAVRDANLDVASLNRSLKFRIHDGTGQLMVEIVDRDSGNVIRTNPPEEFLDLSVRMKEMVGFFLDETR